MARDLHPLRLEAFTASEVVRPVLRAESGRPVRTAVAPLELAPVGNAGIMSPRAVQAGVPPRDEPPQPPPTFSRAELDAAVAAARADAAAAGAAAARDEMAVRIEQRQSAALVVLARELSERRVEFDRMIEARARASQALALAMARALVPRALALAPLADIEPMLRDLVARLEGQPRLLLRLPPDLVEPGRRLILEVAADARFEGALETRADPALGPGDAELLWQDGRAERRLELIALDAEALVRAWLPEPPEDGAAAQPPESEPVDGDHDRSPGDAA